MAKKSSGGSGGAQESKMGLILTLIFFILATFILGTLAYFGYAEQEKLVKAKQDADKATKNAQAIAEEFQARMLTLRLATGTDAQDDQQNFAALVNQRRYAVQDEYTKIVAKLRERLPDGDFDWPLDAAVQTPNPRPVKTLPELVLEFKDAMAKANQKAADAEKLAQDKQKEADQSDRRATAAKAEFDKKVEALSAQFKQLQADKSDGFTKIESMNDDLSKAVEKIKRDKKNSEGELERQIALLQEEMVKKDQKIAFYESQRRPPDVDLNQPKGKIVRRDRDVVYIDLGSAQGLRPQITFSVFPADRSGSQATRAIRPITIDLAGRISTGDSGRLLDAPPEMKGAIEVLEILGPTVASARITYEVDPIRNPIRVDDILFNPAWSPGQKEHVAIVGMIDLNGDGLDDNEEFIRLLQKQGVVVDAYIDLRDQSVQGKITLQTSYLIRGESVQLDGNFNPGGADSDPRAIVKRRVIEAMTKLEDQAKDLGVQPISARRFMAMNGIKLPANPARADYAAGRYLRNLGAADPEPMKDGQ